MNQFFYEYNGQSMGPVTEGSLHSLVNLRQITPDTLVWHEGMANWQRYDERFPGGAPATAGDPNAQGSSDFAQCAVSGRTGLKSEMVNFGGVHVLPEHRDVYVQRLQQGYVAPQDYTIAGCWPRLGASFLDTIIVFLPVVVLAVLLGSFTELLDEASTSRNEDWTSLAFGGAVLILSGLYEVLMIGSKGATLGKMAAGIKVIQEDGTPPTYGTAFKRFLIKGVVAQLCGLVPLISAIKVLVDSAERKALHDDVAHTRVVKA